MRKYILSIMFAGLSLLNVFVFSPAPAFATGICGSTNTLQVDSKTGLCVNAADRRTVGDILIRVINFLLLFAALIAILMIVIGGYKYITSAGNAETAKSGKATVVNAIIGLAIIILSFVIVSVVNNTLSCVGNPSIFSQIFGTC